MAAWQELVGKFTADGSCHPLVCHMIDVAAVAEALWDTRLPRVIRTAIAADLGLAEGETRSWMAFIAGLHDLGKASGPFQNRAPGVPKRLEELGLPVSTRADAGHGLVTTDRLPPLLRARGLRARDAAEFGAVAGGHHGRFLEPSTARLRNDIGEGHPATQAVWEHARGDLFETLRHLVGASEAPLSRPRTATAMAIAGFISVADWIGSATQYFPFAGKEATDDLEAYLLAARRQAIDALDAIHWRIPVSEPTTTFEDTFGLGPPRPLQVAALECPPCDGTPGLVIIESVMGEGKTEAALLFAERWREAGFPGLFFGLPTQATANQLHGRVARYLERRFPHDLVAISLAHGGAWLRDDVPALPDLLPEHIDAGREEREATVGAGSWFATAKRALLAPFGVGTIDQSLFSVLQVRHVFVRLFGLAGKVVVIDEVHAYDAYMTSLLERLLEWLAALGSPVVLLSATLPSKRREALIDAYHRGASGGKGALYPLGPVSYPSILRLEAGSVHVAHPEVSARSRRRLLLASVNPDRDLTQLLTELLANGGCAAVICNTVSRAQELFARLRPAFDGEIALFHSRFVLADRRRIEEECVGRFGASGMERPKRYVLVATQVIEQSIDLDFDVMVTEFAPVDLLLQRSGRLWRHERPGRTGTPALHVTWPEEADGVPVFEPGTKAVYDEHILLRTWLALGSREGIDVPEDIAELVDQVYSDEEYPPGGLVAGTPLAVTWRGTHERLQEKRRAEQAEAQARRIKPPWNTGGVRSILPDPREEDAPDLHPALQALTRLAEPTVEVVVVDPSDPAVVRPRIPDREETRRLLSRSVKVAHQGLVRFLAKTDPPEQWANSSALSRHRLVVMENGQATELGDFDVAYDSLAGLQVRRR